MKKFRIIDLFSEQDGTASFSRVSSSIIISFMLSWVTFVTIKAGKLPDLSGAALFLSGSIGALYGANKVATAISGRP